MIPEEWLPPVAVRRIICHSEPVLEVADDLRLCYHFLVARSGAVARGFFSLADNAHPQRGFANHTRMLNVGSAGVCVLGNEPNRQQWDSLVELVALLCKRYRIDITERTLLVHSEVERVFGIDQHGACDLQGCGDTLRAAVRETLFPPPAEEPTVFQPLLVGNRKIVGLVENGRWWIPAAQLAKACGLTFAGRDGTAEFTGSETQFVLPAQKHVIYGIEYICVPLREFLRQAGRHVVYDQLKKSLVLMQPDV